MSLVSHSRILSLFISLKSCLISLSFRLSDNFFLFFSFMQPLSLYIHIYIYMFLAIQVYSALSITQMFCFSPARSCCAPLSLCHIVRTALSLSLYRSLSIIILLIYRGANQLLRDTLPSSSSASNLMQADG